MGRLRLITFGEFRVYSGEERIRFKYGKTRELLAILTDRRGGLCSTSYLIDLLWENKNLKSWASYFQNLRSDLRNTLSRYGCSDAVFFSRGLMSINTSAVYCDYYDYLNGLLKDPAPDPKSYMQEFNWSDESFLPRLPPHTMIVNNTSDTPKVRFITFSNFGVYVGEKPVRFKYKKTLEMLAVLVDRMGRLCSLSEIMECLWQEESNKIHHSSYVRHLKSDLLNTFASLGLVGIFRQEKNMLGIHVSEVICDYYDYLLTLKNGEKPFWPGEYMSEYSWAEPTIARIVKANDREKEALKGESDREA